MAILGITNRTENWKTAAYFAPLSAQGSLRLAKSLLPEGARVQASDLHLELFWRGMRDHLNQKGETKEERSDDFLSIYTRRFGDLRGKIEAFGGFRDLKEDNYRASPMTGPRLSNNLVNTEIDIVIETADHLLIGEAKHEMSFHAHSGLILTHQLMRQYVMARILLDLREHEDKTVVPFVVGDNAERMKKRAQVQFMRKHYGLRPENVLEWSDIEALR